jgi:hypothetical protein
VTESLGDDRWTEVVEHAGVIASELARAKPDRSFEGASRSIEDADITTLVLLVMLQASRSAEEDLKAALDEIRALNRQKQRLRDLMAKLKASDLDEAIDRLKNELDALAELGEEQQLRLQQFMDRQARLCSTVSNIMKTLSETSASIISNLK